MYGGNWTTNLLMGAAFGAIGGYFGPQLYGAFGGGLKGVLGAAAILGGSFGGVSAAISGGNIVEGIASGAVSAAILSAAGYGAYKFVNWVLSQNEIQAAQADCWSAQCHSDALRRAVSQMSLAEEGRPEPLSDEGPHGLARLAERTPGQTASVAAAASLLVAAAVIHEVGTHMVRAGTEMFVVSRAAGNAPGMLVGRVVTAFGLGTEGVAVMAIYFANKIAQGDFNATQVPDAASR
jgi:hypothetical protein